MIAPTPAEDHLVVEFVNRNNVSQLQMYIDMWIPTMKEGMKEAAEILQRTSTRMTQFFQTLHQPARRAGAIPTNAPTRTRQSRAQAARSTRNMRNFVTVNTPAGRTQNRARSLPPNVRRRRSRRVSSNTQPLMTEFVRHQHPT